MHAADLILPAIVDAGHPSAVNVRPRRSVVDNVVPANVDLTDVHVADVVANSVADVWAIADVWTVADIIANPGSGSVGKPIRQPVARSRGCRPLQRFVQSEKVSQITGGGPSSVSGQVWSVSGQVRSTTGARCPGS